MGELPAVLAAACLSLEYIAAAAAVARSWGDKVVAWMEEQHYGAENDIWASLLLKSGDFLLHLQSRKSAL